MMIRIVYVGEKRIITTVHEDTFEDEITLIVNKTRNYFRQKKLERVLDGVKRKHKNIKIRKMKKLDKYVLESLCFESVYVSAEESGDRAFVYYVLELGNRESLISNSIDTPFTGDEVFKVNLFNSELGNCETDEEVKVLYKALKGKELCPIE